MNSLLQAIANAKKQQQQVEAAKQESEVAGQQEQVSSFGRKATIKPSVDPESPQPSGAKKGLMQGVQMAAILKAAQVGTKLLQLQKSPEKNKDQQTAQQASQEVTLTEEQLAIQENIKALQTLPALQKPFEKNGKLEVLKSILTKPVKRRTEEELQDALLPLLKDIQFFRERDNIKETDFNEIGQCLTYEHMKKGQNVFEWGSLGDKFYLTLQGTVSVWVPNDQYKQKISMLVRQEVFKMVLETNDEQKLKLQKVLDAGITPPEGMQVKPQSKDQKSSGGEAKADRRQSFSDRLAEVDGSIFNKTIKQYLASYSEHEDLQQYHHYSHFKEVVQLTLGQAFGELALITNNPRAATIKCLTDCHFAVISKNVFERILKKIEVKNQNKLVDFFQHLPFFKGWSRTALAKLKYVFTLKEYLSGQFVVRENETCEKIMLVRSGEFDVVRSASSVQMVRLEEMEREQEQVRKMVQIERNKKEDAEMLGSGAQVGKSLASFIRNDLAGKKPGKKTLPFVVATLGPGELFGDYECYGLGMTKRTNFEFSLICRTVKAEILELDKVEFARRIGVFPDVIPRIIERSKEKRFIFYRQIINNKTVQQHRRLNSMENIQTGQALQTNELGSPQKQPFFTQRNSQVQLASAGKVLEETSPSFERDHHEQSFSNSLPQEQTIKLVKKLKLQKVDDDYQLSQVITIQAPSRMTKQPTDYTNPYDMMSHGSQILQTKLPSTTGPNPVSQILMMQKEKLIIARMREKAAMSKQQFSSPGEILSTKASISVASSLSQSSRRYLQQKEQADHKVINIIKKNVKIHSSVSMYQLGNMGGGGGKPGKHLQHLRSASGYQ